MPSLPFPRSDAERFIQHGTPSGKLTPSAARLRDFADRLDAEGSHRMAALVRRAAEGVAPESEVPAPQT